MASNCNFPALTVPNYPDLIAALLALLPPLPAPPTIPWPPELPFCPMD